MSDKLQKIIDGINKKHGDGALMRLSDLPQNVDVFSTGVIGLDLAMGVGGWPRGKVVEMHGKESSGKTTLSLLAIAEAQKEGYPGAFIDMEHALDTTYAEALGVDLKQLFIAQPQTGEIALEIANDIAEQVGIVVIDSVPALVPQARIEGEMGDKNYGDIAHLLSRALPKLKQAAQNGNALIMFLNQMRVDLKGFAQHGTPMKTYGGEAIKYYSDMRLKLWRQFDQKTKEEEQFINAEVVKNKVAPPFKKTKFTLEYGKGVDKMLDLVTVAVDMGIIEQKGSWFSYEDIKFQGADKFADQLLTYVEYAGEIKKAVLG